MLKCALDSRISKLQRLAVFLHFVLRRYILKLHDKTLVVPKVFASSNLVTFFKLDRF